MYVKFDGDAMNRTDIMLASVGGCFFSNPVNSFSIIIYFEYFYSRKVLCDLLKWVCYALPELVLLIYIHTIRRTTHFINFGL